MYTEKMSLTYFNSLSHGDINYGAPIMFKEKLRHIIVELKGHAPFTSFGALFGIVFMLLFRNTGSAGIGTLFAVFHPSHVVLSAMVTTSMFKLHEARRKIILILVVGYLGSVGIATLSDIVIPHIGAKMLKLDVPSHAEMHRNEDAAAGASEHENGLHLGFIEEWYIVNPAALLGIFIAFFLPRTKFPHAAHVLISTWASSAYLLMNIQSQITVAAALGVFAILFIAIWVPCCISDIIFPLLFVKSDIDLADPCHHHQLHSHPHTQKAAEN